MKLIINKPNEKQELFLKDNHKFVAFGGARGGGKSWAVRTKAKLLAVRFSGIRLCIVRRTYPELRANHIDTLRLELQGVARYIEGKKEFVFKNGSRIFCRYCQNENDMRKFQGTEYDVVFIDEATQFSEMMFHMIAACVRGVNSFPKRVYLTCNPGGEGHSWVKRLFIDRRYNAGERGEDYSFIKSLVTDNKALLEADPDYIRQLESLPPKLRKAWLEGDWNIFEGQFFEEFRDDPDHYKDRRYTHVIEPFEVPSHWPVYRSYDFGYGKPFDASWWAVDGEGRAYLILQLYGCGAAPNTGVKWSPDRQFAEIHRIESEHRWLKGKNIIGIADPSIWDSSRGEAIVDAADRYFVHFSPGDNKRIPGWMQCHYRFQFDGEGRPMVYFFNTCKEAIRTIPLLSFSKTNPEDLDTDGEDHFADSFRYFAMSRPLSARDVETTAKEWVTDDPLELNAKKYKRYTYV